MEAGEILLRSGLLDERKLQMSRDNQRNGASVLDSAVELGFVTEENALQAVGDEVGLDFVDLSKHDVDPALLENFPQKIIYRNSLFPISRENGSITVATSDPFDLYPLDEVGSVTGLSVTPVLAGRREIAKLIKDHLGVGSETVEGLVLAAEEDGDDALELLGDIETDGSELSEMAQEASVIRLVNEILLEAIESRASDVHIESQASGIVIRYRIDGMLHPQPVPAEINRFHAAIISRLKIMSRLNIAEKRLPQDGRMKLKVHNREVDVRVSVIPMINGEGIVMRILDKGAMVFDLQGLGMSQGVFDTFMDLINMPHGIVLVTGPTGSGKTTTLYSSLLEIKKPETKIITTEDPVEYQLEGINQIQVQGKIGLSFAASLRAILRHDPDVVLVGEIRDKETAENAIQASLTGHLVFSTLHTNDAAGAFIRLIDIGVEPFLVASTVEGIMAQRLVRRLCESCKVSFEANPEELPKDFPLELLEDCNGTIYRSVGCRKCRHVGYSGRSGIYELLVASQEIRDLSDGGGSTWDVKQAAIRSGMKTLRQDAYRKVTEGTTTLEEVVRVTKGDRA